MHVALCLFRYFPHGGMQRDAVATARLLQDRGHHVRLLCHSKDAPPPEDITLELLTTNGSTNHARASSFASALAERLKALRPDAVLGFDKMPGLDLYFAADPCFVARTAGRPWPYRLTPRYRVFAALERAVFGPGGPRILLLDERERTRFQDVYGTDSERFVTLPPGVQRDRRRSEDAPRQRAACRAALGVGEDDFVLLLLASNYHLKGLDRALRGLAALPAELRSKTLLLAVGAGVDPTWRRRLKSLGLAERCRLLPGRDDVPDLLQAADLLVHPARRDTTGTVLLEAIAAGLPVLCSDACGYAQRVQDACAGVVLPSPFCQTRFDEALHSMRAGPLTQMQQASLRYAAEVDLHGMHDQVAVEVERAASRSRGHHVSRR